MSLITYINGYRQQAVQIWSCNIFEVSYPAELVIRAFSLSQKPSKLQHYKHLFLTYNRVYMWIFMEALG